MTPATRMLWLTIIRHLKGMIKALETWLESQPEKR